MDEVPDRELQGDASALDVTYCQPCFRDGESLPAEAYCTVCKEFMCSTCTEVHKKQRMTKSHTLLDKYTMPTTMRHLLIDDEMTEHCAIHPGEFIKYFCPTHQTLNCGHCFVLNHESCRQQSISEIAKAFNDGPGYGDIKQALAQLLSDIDTCASNVEDNINLVEKLSERKITKLQEYRDQVNKYFDEREKSLLGIITQMKTMDKTLLDSLKPKCDKLKTHVNEIKPKLKAQENNPCQLFMEAQKAKNLLDEMQSTLAEINKENSIQMYQFMKDPISQMMLTSKTGLGTIKEMGSPKAPDRILNQASSTTQAKGETETTKSDAETNVQAGGDTQAVKTTKKVSPNELTKGAPMNPSRIQIQRNLNKYQHPDLAFSDVIVALSTFSDLWTKEEDFVFNDGTMKALLQLSGTIPIKYKDNTYNIPICICLMDTHPYDPPIVFVKPTTTMCIKPERYWDINGTICLPYLREWKYPESDLSGMIQRLTVVFEEYPPVYSILRNKLDAMVQTDFV